MDDRTASQEPEAWEKDTNLAWEQDEEMIPEWERTTPNPDAENFDIPDDDPEPAVQPTLALQPTQNPDPIPTENESSEQARAAKTTPLVPAPRKPPISTASQTTLLFEETSPSEGRVDTSQLAQEIAIALRMDVNEAVSRTMGKLVSTAEQQMQALAQGLSEAKTELNSEVDTQVGRLSSILTEKVSNVREHTNKVAQAHEMMLDDLKRVMTEAKTELVATSKEVTSSIEKGLQDAQEAVETNKRSSQSVGDRIAAASRMFTLKHTAMVGSVMLLTMLVGGFILYKVSPGWTLTPAQHEALYLGNHVIRQFQQADPAKKAEMCTLLGLQNCDRVRPPGTMSQ